MALCKAVTRCRDPQETRNDGDRMIISASTGMATRGEGPDHHSLDRSAKRAGSLGHRTGDGRYRR
jgi:hypothetical protein